MAEIDGEEVRRHKVFGQVIPVDALAAGKRIRVLVDAVEVFDGRVPVGKVFNGTIRIHGTTEDA